MKDADDYEVDTVPRRFLGTADGFGVYRKNDGTLVSRTYGTREEAEQKCKELNEAAKKASEPPASE